MDRPWRNVAADSRLEGDHDPLANDGDRVHSTIGHKDFIDLRVDVEKAGILTDTQTGHHLIGARVDHRDRLFPRIGDVELLGCPLTSRTPQMPPLQGTSTAPTVIEVVTWFVAPSITATAFDPPLAT